MPSYDDIRKAANNAIPIGCCVSMPVPIMREGSVLDVFFLYSVDRQTWQPRRPEVLLEVDPETRSVNRIDQPDVFKDVVFVESDFVMPNDYSKLSDAAKDCYEAARGEFAHNLSGDALTRYAELICAITQKSLLPFYEALAPSVFGQAE